jgi:HD-like signal output (HDOD) protein
MDAWKLPDPIRDAVLWHHEPPPVERGKPFALARILHAANSYVDAFGHSIETELHGATDPLSGIHSLGMSPAAQQQVLDQFQLEHAAIAQFYR